MTALRLMMLYLLGGAATCLYMTFGLWLTVKLAELLKDAAQIQSARAMREQMNGSFYAVLFVTWPPFAGYLLWTSVLAIAHWSWQVVRR